MNKLFFILIFSVLFSCSSSDSEESNQSSSCINPPEWLQGTWVKYDNNEPDVIVSKFVISADNIISFDYSNSTDWKIIYCDKEPIITTSEAFESTYYKFTWTTNYSGLSTTLNGYFIKQTVSNKMMYNNYLDDEGILYTKL
ncbi:MAG: hypothetical protein ACOVOQ_01165 [Flavobacterium sp.]|jgi:hypothetical protein